MLPLMNICKLQIRGNPEFMRTFVRLYLGKLALLVDERDDVHGFDGDHVQSVLVVGELDVLPVDVFQVVLLLLQLEDVTHKELLQVLVGEVDAELLKAAGKRTTGYTENAHNVFQMTMKPATIWRDLLTRISTSSK